MNPVKIEIINTIDYEQELIKCSHSLFVTRQWIEAMCTENNNIIYLKFIKHHQTVALLGGLILSGSRLQGRQLYFYAAPALCQNNNIVLTECLQALKHFARMNGYSRINIRPWDQQHSLPVKICGFINTQTHEFPLRLDGFDSHAQISSRIWRNIKKGQKQQVEIRKCKSMNTLDILLTLLTSTQTRRVIKFGADYSPFYLYNLNRDTIERLINSDAAVMYCATIENKVYSIELNIEYNKKAYNILKASIDEAYHNGISSYLDYHLIQQYQDNGYDYFNLGGELMYDEGPGLTQFKMGLGGEKMIKRGYYTYYLTFPRNLLNPVMKLGKALPDNSAVNWAKQQVSRILSVAGK